MNVNESETRVTHKTNKRSSSRRQIHDIRGLQFGIDFPQIMWHELS